MRPLTPPHSLSRLCRPCPFYSHDRPASPMPHLLSVLGETLHLFASSEAPLGPSSLPYYQGRPDPVSAKSEEALESITTPQALPCWRHSPNLPDPSLCLLGPPVHPPSHCSSGPGSPAQVWLWFHHSPPPCPFPHSNRPDKRLVYQRKTTSPVSPGSPCSSHPDPAQTPLNVLKDSHHLSGTGLPSKLSPP